MKKLILTLSLVCCSFTYANVATSVASRHVLRSAYNKDIEKEVCPWKDVDSFQYIHKGKIYQISFHKHPKDGPEVWHVTSQEISSDGNLKNRYTYKVYDTPRKVFKNGIILEN